MSPDRIQRALDFFEMSRKASEDSVRSVVLESREHGWPMVIQRDGKVIHLPADEFVLPGEELGPNAKVRPIADQDAAADEPVTTDS